MAVLPEDMSVAIDELETAVAEMESRLETARAERDDAKARQVELEIENANLRRELILARERQVASAEILAAIAITEGDAEHALQQIAGTAQRFFDASSVTIRITDGKEWIRTIRVGRGSERIMAAVPAGELAVDGKNVAGLVYRENRQVHVPDIDHVDASIADFPGWAPARAGGSRTVSGTPLRLGAGAIGAMIIHRDRLAAFTNEELALQQSFADQAVIAIENARLFRDTQEALERQTATADILKVIASSPSDVQPVFEAIAASSKRLLAGFSTTVFRLIDGVLHLVAFTPTNAQADTALTAMFPRPIADFPPFTMISDGRMSRIEDTESDAGVPPMLRDIARLRGYRAMLLTPLMREGVVLGMISVTREKPGAWAEHHADLLRTFADQAVIAIENARLFNEVTARTEELSEALQQQTAVGDVLKTISRSTFDLQPVLDTLVNTAALLCNADMAFIMRRVGDEYRAGAAVGYTPAYIEFLANHPLTVDRGTVTGRAVIERRPVQIPDVIADPEYTLRETTTLAGQRTTLGVPLLRENEPIGVIVLARQRVETFTQKQIDLVTTFADQAVIAIENVRLFDELRQRTDDLSEALRQQTATADVLKVISRSAFDLKPVLDALLASACHLCDADIGTIRYREDGDFRLAATFGCLPEWVEQFSKYSTKADRGTVFGRTIIDGHTIHIPDVLADPDFKRLDAQKLMGFRAALGVPLTREGQAFGVINLFRFNAGSFQDRQIELVQTFADQAVIAIENVRLFDEVQAKTRDLEEALQQQTATADVLKLISRSAFDLQAVLNTLTESAARLCNADMGAIALQDERGFYHATNYNFTIDWIKITDGLRLQPGKGSLIGRTLLASAPVQITDVLSDPDYRFPDMQQAAGYRSLLGVPLMRGGEAIGVLFLGRKTVEPYSDRQIELVSTFADQAVIAIENVRLFDEVQAKTRDLEEALTYQTGSANILSVIASSPTNVEPVLQAIAKSACELCEAYDAIVRLRFGDSLRAGAHHGQIPIATDEWPINRDSASGRAILEGRPIHLHDMQSAEGDEFPESQERALRLGHRTILSVPLIRDGDGVGVIILRRTEAKPFTDKQIALLQTFADQAVIAIGNVRLFEEVQAKTRDLSEALEYQTATGDVLNVISRSPNNLQPVMDTIVQTAQRLCDSEYALIMQRRDDDSYRIVAHANAGQELLDWLRDNPVSAGDGSAVGIVAVEKETLHLHDALTDPRFTDRRRQEVSKARTMLAVPLMKEDQMIGVVFLGRTAVQPFTDKQVELVTSFADQAVIAISNVNLFEEVQARTRDLAESLQQQTATADVLKVISASPGEPAPVFQAMLENAVRLCEAKFAMLFLLENEQYRAVKMWNLPPAYNDFLTANPIRVDPGIPLGRILETKQPVQVVDVLEDQSYINRHPGIAAVADLGGARTLLQVPMLKDDRVVGSIGIYRQEVRPFEDKQVALVRNFAAQAVIAIENARLLNELRQRTSDLSRSLDDLRTAQDRLVQTEKLASLGQLTAGIAHEIKNPLNFVNNFAALSAELTDELNDVLKPADLGGKMRADVDELTELLKGNLEKVVQHGKRADSIVKNMLLHSRQGGGEHRPSDINALVDESLNLAYHGARAEKPDFNVTLERDFDPATGEVDLFPQEITRVFLNLVSNGFHAVTKRKKEGSEPGFEPRLRASTRNLGDAVEIRIRDNGTGIPPEVREKMFDPFFTTKPAGEGTGLGLSMSHDIIVKQHGGTIEVATEQDHFTEFRIVLPRTSNFAEEPRG